MKDHHKEFMDKFADLLDEYHIDIWIDDGIAEVEFYDGHTVVLGGYIDPGQIREAVRTAK